MTSSTTSFFTALLLLVTTTLFSQTTEYDAFLQKHVSAKGVDYSAMLSNHEALDAYIFYAKDANINAMTALEKKAFLINVYNAYTLKLMLMNPTVASITEIKSGSAEAWDIPFVNIGNAIHTLNDVEHKMLRPVYKDARIHAAVNCASESCPPLHNRAFTSSNVESYLELLMKNFVRDSQRNQIQTNALKLSRIFDWYRSDFETDGTLITYLNQYSAIPIATDASIDFLPYSWRKNSVK